MKVRLEKIALWIKNKVLEAGAEGTVFGLSGGVDSSIVAVLCKKAFPHNILALIMPCHSHPQDMQDAIKVAEKFNIKYFVIDLSKVYDKLLEVVLQNVNKNYFIAEANIKSRLRMTTLYYYANLYNYLVVGTGNKSEILTGYFTKYGDGGVDIEPIGNLYKTEVYEAAKILGIPESIINKKPSAGLWVGQTDEQEMGMSYKELDRYLITGEGPSHVAERVQDMIKKSEHKRNIPPIPDF
ncbi:MAG: NAD(+) synthase [Clostridia bacterium]|nr:NAD(+) synthase [Clostridia bacterium]